jgi:hypothetical protein
LNSPKKQSTSEGALLLDEEQSDLFHTHNLRRFETQICSFTLACSGCTGVVQASNFQSFFSIFAATASAR